MTPVDDASTTGAGPTATLLCGFLVKKKQGAASTKTKTSSQEHTEQKATAKQAKMATELHNKK
jgi:hypothetical protein